MPAPRSKSPPKPPRPAAARTTSRRQPKADDRPLEVARITDEFDTASVRPRRLSISDTNDESSERETLPAPAPTSLSAVVDSSEGERSSVPELVFSETTAGPELMAAIAAELGGEAPSLAPAPSEIELLELVTFLARGPALAQLASEALRKEFVEQRLLHRLPVKSMDDVDHIDLAPWTVSNTMVLRVWCKITAPRS